MTGTQVTPCIRKEGLDNFRVPDNNSHSIFFPFVQFLNLLVAIRALNAIKWPNYWCGKQILDLRSDNVSQRSLQINPIKLSNIPFPCIKQTLITPYITGTCWFLHTEKSRNTNQSKTHSPPWFLPSKFPMIFNSFWQRKSTCFTRIDLNLEIWLKHTHIVVHTNCIGLEPPCLFACPSLLCPSCLQFEHYHALLARLK